LSYKDWQSAANEQFGISGSTFNRFRCELEQQGKVLKSNGSNKWERAKPTQ
jgi:hypothetical protein